MSVLSGLSTAEGNASTQIDDLETALGPLLIGTLLATALWGTICIQTYDYYITPNEDRRWEKIFVALLYLLGTLDTVMNIITTYHYLVTNFINPDVLSLVSAVWSSACRALFVTLSTFTVRTLFTRRIYIMSKENIYLTAWIMIISLGDLIVGIVGVSKAFIRPSPDLTIMLYFSFSFGIASDLSVTLALLWFLYSMRSGVRRKESPFHILILYVVTTGSLVVIDTTLMLIFHTIMPKTWIFTVFYYLMGKLYINAYLASLNTREILKKNQANGPISLSRMSYQRKPAKTTADDKPSFLGSDHATTSAEGQNIFVPSQAHSQSDK